MPYILDRSAIQSAPALRAGFPGRELARGCAPDHSTRRSSMTPTLDALRIKIFADGADKAGMLEMARKPHIAGLTTNPTLMRKAGISDYRAFAKDILSVIADKPISFEVFSDDFTEMERQ